MLRTILLGLLMFGAVLTVIIARQPSEFIITRSTTIAAPPSTVFEQVNDLHQWAAWSPWTKLDPNAKNTFEGPAAGEGAVMRWVGNNQVGEGSMTIVESKPAELLRFQLDFLKPFKATHSAEFNFKLEGDQTAVSWSMSGQKNFVAKAMSLIMNCDKMIGEQFEKGLASLKSVSESVPAQPVQ